MSTEIDRSFLDARISIDDIIEMEPCEAYCDVRCNACGCVESECDCEETDWTEDYNMHFVPNPVLIHIGLGGRESVAVRDVFDLDILASDRLWLLTMSKLIPASLLVQAGYACIRHNIAGLGDGVPDAVKQWAARPSAELTKRNTREAIANGQAEAGGAGSFFKLWIDLGNISMLLEEDADRGPWDAFSLLSSSPNDSWALQLLKEICHGRR